MNKTAIKNFAVWARNKLIADITYKAGLIGVSENGIADPLPQSSKDLQFFDIGTKEYSQVARDDIKQRDALVTAIQNKEKDSDYKTAFKAVIEEIAYTWFNRLIAIRFMEVNDYLPSRVRVLSSENPAKKEPDFVTTPYDTDLEFSTEEQEKIMQLKDENKLDDLFRMLFIKQCNKLHEILPELFEKTNDYTELLLNIAFTDEDGVVYHLVHDIDEEDFNIEKEGQVEIIGWMYQYYIAEKHNQVINIYKGTVKKEDIPAATQLFTTDWVVRYMVDNSLGRYWIERNPSSNLADKLEYFVTPKDGKINYISEKVEPQDLTFFDPCMGSGHILVYAFDVLLEIYRECGYTDRDAAINIVEKNLFGLDIDKRAYQLAYFAVMMKVRSNNRKALTNGVKCNLASIEESNSISKFTQASITLNKEQNKVGEYLVEVFKHAKEIGSLLSVERYNYGEFCNYINKSVMFSGQIDFGISEWLASVPDLMIKLAQQAIILSGKYAVVCTNPPYMNKLESHLKEFVIDNYKPYSGDLFSVFMYRNFEFCKKDGYSAFMTPFVWMFIKTYENLREYIISNKAITSLIQMEYSAYEEATVPICSFVLKNGMATSPSYCFRLSDFKGGMQIQKQKVLEAISDKNCGYYYESEQDNFSKIPGSPIAYWVSEKFIKIFVNGTKLSTASFVKKGLTSADNNHFLRFWQEVNFCNFSTDNLKNEKKWFPTHKGGDFRRWYGNTENIINWEHNGRELKAFSNSVIRNEEYYGRTCITWNDISSSKTSFRFVDYASISNASGPSIYEHKLSLYYIIGICNSIVAEDVFHFLCPTIHFEVGQVANLPIIRTDNSAQMELIEHNVKCNIEMSKSDWDSFEISWDFVRHPLINDKPPVVSDQNTIHCSLLTDRFNEWQEECTERFNTLKANEEELNRIFIEIYGLQDELTPEIADKDITVRKAELQRDIKSLLSYAVGCMLGRYSLDVDGLAYAGGEWDNSKYKTYLPDADNCLPITDEEYFEDDIVGRLVEFVKVVYGKETLEENLGFIARALGNKGDTSREIIRNYFLNDFIKDHIKIYQKRPIYWLFDSGKQNGFKALVYMHRWNADTVGNLRVEYLHKIQRTYESEIIRMQEAIDNSHDPREVARATKRKDKLQKQLKETKDYDVMLAHIALSRIEIDLDDGVKVNYEKVQTGRDGKKLQILAKI